MRTTYSLGLFVALSAASSASATILFSDGFETAVATPDTWAQQEALAPGSRTDNDPANTTGASFFAVAGQWFHYAKSGTPVHDIAVTSNAAPGPYAGNNYLRMHRSGDQAVIAAAATNWDTPLTTGQVHAQWRMRIPDVGDSYVGGVYMPGYLDNDHNNGTTGAGPTIFFQGDGDVRISENEFGNNYFLGSPPAAHSEWQLWEMDADLDAETYTLKVNGISAGTFAFNYTGVNNPGLTGLAFNSQPGFDFYVDDVEISVIPEPACAALLALGGLALVRRRAF